MELQAVFGQLHIVNGANQESSPVPGLLAQTAPSKPVRSRENDFLFVHITLSGPAQGETALLNDIVDSISSKFYQTPGSVTAALRSAIVETNKRLLEYNINSADRPREGALTCAVQRKDELYVAQVGEAVAMIGHNFGIERLAAGGEDFVTPMGRAAGVNIRFYHNWLQSGDMLLISDPRLSHLSTDVLEPVLVGSSVEDGTEDLIEIIGSDSARVLLIEFTVEAPAYFPDAVQVRRESVSGRRLPPPTGQPYRLKSSQPASRGSVKEKTPIYQVDIEVVETSARKATSEAAKGLAKVTAWLANFLNALRPPRKAHEPYGGWAMPMFLAIGIPLTVTVIVAGVYFQRGNVEEVSDIKSGMRDSMDNGRQAEGDLQAMSEYYGQVLHLADLCTQMRPGDAECLRYRAEALSALDAMNGVARLMANLVAEYPADVELASIAIGDYLNGEVFTFDRVGNRVFIHETGENYSGIGESEPKAILSKGQAIGNQVVGEISDIMWRPRGNDVSRDGIAVLDKGGVVFSYYTNLADTRAVPLGLAIDWIDPTSITGYFERIYILDREAGEIWKYLPEGDGFLVEDDERTLQFDGDVDISHVSDFDIYSEDGSVILLYEDGRIARYASGRLLWNEEMLFDSGLSSPMVSPSVVKIDGRGLSSSIFILDPGSERLIQISHGGTYLAQYKIADQSGEEILGRANDIAIAQDPFRIFVVADNQLYLTSQD